jgi:hypothetical protein
MTELKGRTNVMSYARPMIHRKDGNRHVEKGANHGCIRSRYLVLVG